LSAELWKPTINCSNISESPTDILGTPVFVGTDGNPEYENFFQALPPSSSAEVVGDNANDDSKDKHDAKHNDQ